MIEPESGTAPSVEPTGERFVPEAMADSLIEAEHHVRYRFAAGLVGGRRVLDAGCGVGWGSVVLQESGAVSVTSLDIDRGATRDAHRRSSAIRVVQGDLESLPFGDGEFDAITCFEAIEHVADHGRVLDELQRVLAPGGVLMVSSPNPMVYPSGNPFHVHELEPGELLDELGRRFAHAALWLQHGLLAAALSSAGPARTDHSYRVTLLTEAALETSKYSLVVATDGDVGALEGTVTLVSSRQVDELETAAAHLATERRAYLEDHQRIVEERVLVLDEHARAHLEAQRMTEECSALRVERDQLLTRLQVTTRRLELAVADRDRALLLLLDVEQELAARGARLLPPTTGA